MSSVNPITTRGADYAHHITASPPGFEKPAAPLSWIHTTGVESFCGMSETVWFQVDQGLFQGNIHVLCIVKEDSNVDLTIRVHTNHSCF